MNVDRFAHIISLIFIRSRVRDFDKEIQDAEDDYRTLIKTATLIMNEGVPSQETARQEPSAAEQFFELSLKDDGWLEEEMQNDQENIRKRVGGIRIKWIKRQEQKNVSSEFLESIRSMSNRMKRRISSILSALIFVGGMSSFTNMVIKVSTQLQANEESLLSKEDSNTLRLTPQKFVASGGLVAKLPSKGDVLEMDWMPDGRWILSRSDKITNELRILDEMRWEVGEYMNKSLSEHKDVFTDINNIKDSLGNIRTAVKLFEKYGDINDVKELQRIIIEIKDGLNNIYMKYEDDLGLFKEVSSSAYEVWRQQEGTGEISVEAAEHLKKELQNIGITVEVDSFGYAGT